MKIESLNSIIKLKELKREEISIQVKNIQKLIDHYEQNIQSLEVEFERNLKEFSRNTVNSFISADTLRMQHNYVEYLTRKMTEHKKILMERVNELKEALNRLAEAHKEEKLIKKLKTRETDRIIKDEKIREQKHLDDLSIKRYRR